MRYAALSLSTHLVWMLRAEGVPFRVLSLHAHACNLITDDDRLVALVHPSLGNGPFHALVPLPVPFSDALDEDAHGDIVAGRVRLPSLEIDLSTATVWSPRVHWRPVPIPLGDVVALLQSLLAETRGFSPSSAVERAARDVVRRGVEGLARAIVAGDETTARAMVARLLGTGPGLTPAGDDALLGVMAGLWALGLGRTSYARGLAHWVTEMAATRTHRLSREWLRLAGEGAFAASWHALADAMALGDVDRVRDAAARILHTGASSGEYALLGFLAVLQHRVGASIVNAHVHQDA